MYLNCYLNVTTSYLNRIIGIWNLEFGIYEASLLHSSIEDVYVNTFFPYWCFY